MNTAHTKEMFLVKSKHMGSRNIDQCFGTDMVYNIYI